MYLGSDNSDELFEPIQIPDKSRNKMLYKRMASDTDLWLSLKAAQTKYQSKLEATKESPSDNGSTELIVNHVEMPSNDIKQGHKKSPTPSHKRVLNQEEFDR